MKIFAYKAIIIALVLSILGQGLWIGQTDASSFDKNRLIDDSLFTDTDSMSVAQIQAFLDDNGSLLANWVDNVHMRRPSDNCVVHHATGMTAAQIIHEAANSWGAQVYASNGCAVNGAYWSDPGYSNYTLKTVSPKDLLVLLQKEQSLISANGSYSSNSNDYKNPGCCASNEYKLARATGYGVPDSGGINEKYLGFYNQINWAAWQLRYNFERAGGNTGWDGVSYLTYTGPMIEGTFRRCGTCSLEAFDGYYPIDGSPLYMENRATASLYFYTPHTYPGYFGNYNFVHFYEDWFGSTQVALKAYDYDLVSVDSYADAARTIEFTEAATITPGGKAYITVVIKNAGYLSWSPSVRLGTGKPNGSASPFSDSSWFSPGRVTDSLENSIAPGENATFEFSITGPATENNYSQKFTPLIEGVNWMSGNINLPIAVSATRAPLATTDTLLSGESLLPGESLKSGDLFRVLHFETNGNVALYSAFKEAWKTDTKNSGATTLNMQGDGNLVLRDGNGNAVWYSGTNGNPGAYLEVRTDGNVVITNGTTDFWSSDTTFIPDGLSYNDTTISGGRLYPGQALQTANGKYSFMVQPDGNLVFRENGKAATWSSGTRGLDTQYLSIQPDGNLVLRNGEGAATWAATTSGSPGATLFLQTNGNLVLRKTNNKAVWSNGYKH